VKGVIFDLDGTLVTSGLNFSAIRAAIGCSKQEDLLTFIENIADPEARKQATQQVIDFEIQDAEQSGLIEGVADFLQHLQQQGIPTAVVTRNCRAATSKKLERHSLEFETVLTRECAPPKPDPTSLLQISQQWQLPVDELVYVGDYIYDIHAAANAGMRSVLMVFEELPAWHLEATWCFSDYGAFQSLLSDLNAG